MCCNTWKWGEKHRWQTNLQAYSSSPCKVRQSQDTFKCSFSNLQRPHCQPLQQLCTDCCNDFPGDQAIRAPYMMKLGSKLLHDEVHTQYRSGDLQQQQQQRPNDTRWGRPEESRVLKGFPQMGCWWHCTDIQQQGLTHFKKLDCTEISSLMTCWWHCADVQQ